MPGSDRHDVRWDQHVSALHAMQEKLDHERAEVKRLTGMLKHYSDAELAAITAKLEAIIERDALRAEAKQLALDHEKAWRAGFEAGAGYPHATVLGDISDDSPPSGQGAQLRQDLMKWQRWYGEAQATISRLLAERDSPPAGQGAAENGGRETGSGGESRREEIERLRTALGQIGFDADDAVEMRTLARTALGKQ